MEMLLFKQNHANLGGNHVSLTVMTHDSGGWKQTIRQHVVDLTRSYITKTPAT